MDVADKIARNNSVFRDANEQIETAASEHGLDPEQPMPFICECSDEHCTQVIRLTSHEYRRVRSNPRWFAHAVDHEPQVPGVVRLVDRNDRYMLVEKIGHAGDVASSLAANESAD